MSIKIQTPLLKFIATAFLIAAVVIPVLGQGTMNVPSWSPDSERIAFVSNSELTK